MLNKLDTLEKLYNDIDGYNLSALSRIKGVPTNKDLTYGEIGFASFLDIINQLDLSKQHQTFCDLGSGTGKAVLAAAISEKFDYSYGIELLPDLYKASQAILRQFNKDILCQLKDSEKLKIDFFQADFLQYDFSNADVVLVQCTCMSDQTMGDLQEKLNKLKPGSIVITVTQVLKAPFTSISSNKYKMGWGEATVYINKKT